MSDGAAVTTDRAPASITGDHGPATTLHLLAAVRGLRFEDFPAPVVTVAHHCLLDFLGCAIAGAADPLVDILVGETVHREHASEASLIGRQGRATCRTAALVNGAAAHALDYDDTHTTMMGHPSVPVFPGLLALAEAEGLGGRRVLESFVVGVELECRLGGVLGPAHYALGFHSTSIIGAFGAAAAAAHLLGLDEQASLHALGLAGTGAAGLKVSFGTMAKPLHAGRAAAAGLEAALLARRGFTASTTIVEAAQGFAATHGGTSGDAAWLASTSGRFFLVETLFKHHAACYLTHASIEAAVFLREAHSLRVEDIDEVVVRVAATALGVCNIAEPATGLELKFSLCATIALALLGQDTAAPASYSDAHAAHPLLVALRERVVVVADPALAPTASAVSIHTRGGVFEAVRDTGVPAADLVRQERRLHEKFLALATPRLGKARAERLVTLVATIADQPDIDVLVATTRPG